MTGPNVLLGLSERCAEFSPKVLKDNMDKLL
jgi:hypothetical protein